jgi:DNA-binding NtrC family response regulator
MCDSGVSDREILARLVVDRLGLLGASPAFLAEIAKLPALAECDVTVLVTGPTGTGKELVARALHYLSKRHDRPFVPIDCGAMPPELLESELFGHERGAFTGAVTRNRGLIATADEGTLFLDEVDALTLAAQAKLLRFLQQREYRPVGSTDTRKADVRVISATNHDLRKAVREGAMREDLFYRLAVVQLGLPALRERAGDIELLAKHFLAKYTRKFGRAIQGFSPEAMERLLGHEWPGNIRELENVVQAAVALCDGGAVEARHMPALRRESGSPTSFREEKVQAVNRFEREYVVRLLRASSGNISQAARTAKKHRRAFWGLMRKHGIEASEHVDPAADGRKPPRPATARTPRYLAGA